MSESFGDYVGGEVATRILHEVQRGKVISASDTPAEKAYREAVRKSIDAIHKSGASVDTQKDWP